MPTSPTYTCPTCTTPHRLGTDCRAPAAPSTPAAKAIYLSGPMTGLPEFNKPEFNRIAAILGAAGHPILNPAELDAADQAQLTWAQYLTRDLSAMLTHCDSVAVMDGWQHSKGAVLECLVAAALGWPIVHHTALHGHAVKGVQPAPTNEQIFAAAFRLFAYETAA